MSFIDPIVFNTKTYNSNKKYTLKDGTVKSYNTNYTVKICLSENKQLNKNRKLIQAKIKDMKFNELKLVFDFINNLNMENNIERKDNIKI